MARVTVEDCIDKVDSRFDLVLLAAQRARSINSGAPITLERDKDKNPVIALREIAAETVHVDNLKEDLIHSKQRYVETDEFDTGVAQEAENAEEAVEETIIAITSDTMDAANTQSMVFQDISPEEMDD